MPPPSRLAGTFVCRVPARARQGRRPQVQEVMLARRVRLKSATGVRALRDEKVLSCLRVVTPARDAKRVAVGTILTPSLKLTTAGTPSF